MHFFNIILFLSSIVPFIASPDLVLLIIEEHGKSLEIIDSNRLLDSGEQDQLPVDQDGIISVVQTDVGLEVTAGNMKYYFSSETGDVRLEINGMEVITELRPVLWRDISELDIEKCGELNTDSLLNLDLNSYESELKFWNIYGPNHLPTVKSKISYAIDESRSVTVEYSYKFDRTGSVKLEYLFLPDFSTPWLPEVGMEARMRNVTNVEWSEVVSRDSLDEIDSLRNYSLDRKSDDSEGVQEGVHQMVLKNGETSLMILEEMPFFRWNATRNRLRFLTAVQPCPTSHATVTTDEEESTGAKDSKDLKGVLVIKLAASQR